MTPDARIALTFLADLDGGLPRAPLPVPGSEECYSGVDVPTRIVRAAVEALKDQEMITRRDTFPFDEFDWPKTSGDPEPRPASRLNVPERAQGHSKLVYDKGRRTIVSIDPHPKSAGESVGGIAVTAPAQSAVDMPAASASRRENNNDRSGERPLPPPPVELGLETTEARLRELCKQLPFNVYVGNGKYEDWKAEAPSLIDRLVAEVARLTKERDGYMKAANIWLAAFEEGSAREATARAEERTRMEREIEAVAPREVATNMIAAIRARTP